MLRWRSVELHKGNCWFTNRPKCEHTLEQSYSGMYSIFQQQSVIVWVGGGKWSRTEEHIVEMTWLTREGVWVLKVIEWFRRGFERVSGQQTIPNCFPKLSNISSINKPYSSYRTNLVFEFKRMIVLFQENEHLAYGYRLMSIDFLHLMSVDMMTWGSGFGGICGRCCSGWKGCARSICWLGEFFTVWKSRTSYCKSRKKPVSWRSRLSVNKKDANLHSFIRKSRPSQGHRGIDCSVELAFKILQAGRSIRETGGEPCEFDR